MSALLESLCGSERIAEMAKNDAANQPGPMRAFWVRYVRGGIVESQFEAMAEDSVACVIQHMGAANGAAVKVMPLEQWQARCEREAQARAQDELTESDLEAIDAEMLRDKARNGYDSRRIEAAARLERSNPIFGGLR